MFSNSLTLFIEKGSDSYVPIEVRLVDVNSDGDFDAIFPMYHSWLVRYIAVYTNVGEGEFQEVKYYDISCSTLIYCYRCIEERFPMGIVDIDLDGDLDIVLGCSKLLINDGSGRFSGPEYIVVPLRLTDWIRLRDIDNDGDIDMMGVVDYDNSSDELTIFYNHSCDEYKKGEEF